MSRRLALAWAAALALVAAAATVATVSLLSPTRHVDGGGPLGSLGTPVSESMSTDPATGATSWTFGVPLCLANGSKRPQLERVEPIRTVGTGFEVLGMSVRTFEITSEHTPIISVESWPPPTSFVPDTLNPISESQVSTPCATIVDSSAHTELLIGLGKEGSDGGGWEGILVHYRVGDRQYTLEIDRAVKICGSSTSCEIPTETPESGARGADAMTVPTSRRGASQATRQLA